MKKGLVIMTLLAAVLGSEPSFATHGGSAPKNTWGFYVTTKNPATLQSLGSKVEQDVHARGFSCGWFETILAFGKPVYVNGVAGASFFSGADGTTQEIKSLVLAFATGFVQSATAGNRLGCHRIYLSLGTSNQGTSVTQAHGQDWGRMILSTDIDLYQIGVLRYVLALGASDMELDWNGVTTTKNWVTGVGQGIQDPFIGAHWSLITNFGDAAGCVTSGAGGCNNGWSIPTVADISGGMGVGWLTSMPEIYRTDGVQADQWGNILCYQGCLNARADIYGALTQFRACQDNAGLPSQCPDSLKNTPSAGWTQMHNEICSRGGTCASGVPVESIDMRWSFL